VRENDGGNGNKSWIAEAYWKIFPTSVENVVVITLFSRIIFFRNIPFNPSNDAPTRKF
jgi:hypothetical protein